MQELGVIRYARYKEQTKLELLYISYYTETDEISGNNVQKCPTFDGESNGGPALQYTVIPIIYAHMTTGVGK